MKKRVWTTLLMEVLLVLIIVSMVASVAYAPPPPPPPPPPPDFDDQAAGTGTGTGGTAGSTSGGGSTGGGSTSRGGGVPGKDYSYKVPSTTVASPTPTPTPTPSSPAYQQPSYQQPSYQQPQYTPPVAALPEEKTTEAWPIEKILLVASAASNLVLIVVLVWMVRSGRGSKASTGIPENVKIYISTSLKNGYPLDKIRDVLLNSGWSAEQVQQAAMAVQRGQFK